MELVPCPVFHQASCQPQAAALRWSGRTISWEALHNYVHSTSRYLKEIAVRPGSRVLMVMEASPTHVIALLALWRIGAIVCSVHPGMSTENTAAVHAEVKPDIVLSARTHKKTWGQGRRWADVEHVVAYGYNDNFLGSTTAIEPKLDLDAPAVLRLTTTTPEVVRFLSHRQLREDPGELAMLFKSLVTGEEYKI